MFYSITSRTSSISKYIKLPGVLLINKFQTFKARSRGWILIVKECLYRSLNHCLRVIPCTPVTVLERERMVVLKMNRLQMPTPVSVLLLVAAAINALTAQAQLVSNFYNAKCPNAENLITIAVQNAFNSNRASMPGVLRMHFHDCFVHVRRNHQIFFSSSI